MKMRTLSHLSLVVSDVERSAAFYQSLFGMQRQWREGGRVPLLRRIESRAGAWLAEVKKQDAVVTHGPEDYGGYYTFSWRDPDGYAVEIYFEEAEARGRVGDVTTES